MKIKEISESVFIMKTGYNPVGAKIFKNPTRRQILSAFENHKIYTATVYKDRKINNSITQDLNLKGMVIGNNIFIWSPWDGTHDGIYQYLEKEGYITANEENEGDGSFELTLKNNKPIVIGFDHKPYKFLSTPGDQILKKWSEVI